MNRFPWLLKPATHSRSRRLPVFFLMLLLLLLFGLSACASNGGLLGGGNWQSGGLQNQHLQVLAVDPNHLQNIYAGDAQNGVFASTNSGLNWKQSSTGLPLPIDVKALSFDPAGKKLYAATSAGLFASSDSARSWSPVANVPADTYTALTFDVNSPHVVYVATAHSGVLKSSDDGASWTRISSGLPAGAITSLLYDPNLKQLWAAFTNALYRSDDAGANWHQMSSGLPANVGINALALGAVTTSNADLLFAGTNHGFFRSSDAGQHWAPSQFSLAALRISSVLLDATQPATVYASTSIGVMRSDDSGQNWNLVGSGLPTNQPFNGLAQGGNNYSQLFVASRGVYLYPGSSSPFEPSRLLPIILIFLFFILLYFFFGIRRRRPARAPASSDETVEQDSAANQLPQDDEKKES
jgi:ligand-binding sensor domain-containing protein